MPVDQGFAGTNAYLKFGSTVLSTYYRTAETSEDGDLAEYSAGSDANKLYVGTQKDGTYSQEIVVPVGTLGTAIRAAVAPLTTGTLEIAPEGTASTKPKKTGLAIVKHRGEALTYNDITTMAVEWQWNGAVTDSAYS